TLVGAPGGPAGVTELEGWENAPLPTALVARTSKVYAVPLVRPVTLQVSGPLSQVHPLVVSCVARTWYPVIAELPRVAPEQVTVAWPDKAVAVTAPEAPGGVPAVTASTRVSSTGLPPTVAVMT